MPADKINLGFVPGNMVMVGAVNANREHFGAGVYDPCRAALDCPGRLEKLLTHPVEGLENHAETIRLPTEERRAIKVFVNVEEI